MTVYRSKRSQPLKYLLALIVFILALTVTFNDVEGFNLPTDAGGNDSIADSTEVASATGPDDGDTETYPPDTEPVSVPEPTTLLLLAGGLGAMYMLRRRKMK
ncbi:MAG: PEP-CTERM sorting domain-containing protein [Candidatus Zixiibacteriota bacterium]|nr:MAG: PEP-CTERM sorting domain-containing protein [candidate division Zixibacteria bacterium]